LVYQLLLFLKDKTNNMKQQLNGVHHHNRKPFVLAFSAPTIALIFFALAITGCEKAMNEPINEAKSMNAKNTQAEVLNCYSGLATQTAWELQEARAATARFRNFDNAIKDGYADINVVVPNMGHHYLKATILDDKFDYKQPEILVYNQHEDGTKELVAVEYAIPLDLSSNAPEGFTGSGDVWDRNTGFGLWLLHAWVWSYNPNGVFNPLNPSVHTH
jgi:hypothetical protein